MIYLASPYSDPDPAIRQQRYEAVCKAAGELIRRGHVVYSPIAHSHHLSEVCNLPENWEFWRRQDTAMLKLADELWVLDLPGWRESVGVRAEMNVASSWWRHAWLLNPDTLVSEPVALP